MTVIPTKYLKSLCELKTQNNDAIANGNITEITSEYLEITFKVDTKIILHPETLIKICITNSAIGGKIFIGRVYIGSEHQIRLTEIVTLMDFEKREFFRINIYENAIIYKNPITIEETYTTSQQFYPIKIDNISLSGIFFLSDQNFQVGDKVYVILELATGKTVFESKIYRVNDNLPEKKGYGCEFGKLSSRMSDLLYRYIHKKQVEFIQQHQI